MKKLSIVFFILMNFYSVQSQSYKELIRKGDSCYSAKEYQSSVNFYTKAFKIEHTNSAHLYNATCSAALLKEDKKAFEWLNLAIDKGYENITHLQKDRDLLALHDKKEWAKAIAKLQKKLEIVEANYDKPLQKILLDIYADDQDIRRDFMNVYKDPKSDKRKIDSIGKIMVKKDSINLIKVMKILDENGWIGKDVVGAQANQTLFLVIQHSPLNYQQKYLPMMREAVKKSNANPDNLAYLEDRVALREGRRQIYGSQSARNKTTNKWYISAMIDPDNVDKRRAEVGLGTMAEYAAKNNIEWNLETYKKELPELEKLENIK